MRKTGKRLCAALMAAVLGAGCAVPAAARMRFSMPSAVSGTRRRTSPDAVERKARIARSRCRSSAGYCPASCNARIRDAVSAGT